MIESQYGIQSCIDRFRPVFRLQIQRDDLFIYPRILQPGKKISQVIDCDCLPQQPPLVKVCEIMLQEDTCQTECIPRCTSIVPEPQVLQYWFYRCPSLVIMSNTTSTSNVLPFQFEYFKYYEYTTRVMTVLQLEMTPVRVLQVLCFWYTSYLWILIWILDPDVLYGGKPADLKNWAILGFWRSERRKNCKNAIVGVCVII